MSKHELTMKELERILIQNGASIRAIPMEELAICEVRHKDQFPDAEVVYLEEYGREMLVERKVPKMAGKFVIEPNCGTSSTILFHGKQFFDSIEDAVRSLEHSEEPASEAVPTVEVVLVRHRYESSHVNTWIDNYFIPEADVLASTASTLEEKCLDVLHDKIEAFMKTANGFREIIQSCYGFNWGDMAMTGLLQDKPKNAVEGKTISYAVTCTVSQDSCLIPFEPLTLKIIVENRPEQTCLLELDCGDVTDEEGEPLEDGVCKLIFPDGSELEGRLDGSRFSIVRR